MKAGFGWENGPFEIWDAIGVEKELPLWKRRAFSCWLGKRHGFRKQSLHYKRRATYFYNIPTKSQTKFLDKIHSLF
jgi:3-hydroxyacyl-CoA dehydrogenase